MIAVFSLNTLTITEISKMSSKNLTIELNAREDKNKKVFFIGKIKAPVLIDCREGAVFLIYTSEEGSEELQIAVMDAAKEKDDNANSF